jgi:hypothetical protein
LDCGLQLIVSSQEKQGESFVRAERGKDNKGVQCSDRPLTGFVSVPLGAKRELSNYPFSLEKGDQLVVVD